MTMRPISKRGRPRGRSADGPNPIDVYVGGRIRLRRTLLGMSQSKLGEALALSFQQVQKYERGTNRVGSSRMFEIARVLEVEIGYFYDGMPSGTGNDGRKAMHGATVVRPPEDQDPMIKRETLELVRAYYKIGDGRVRKRLFEMTKALANAAQKG